MLIMANFEQVESHWPIPGGRDDGGVGTPDVPPLPERDMLSRLDSQYPVA